MKKLFLCAIFFCSFQAFAQTDISVFTNFATYEAVKISPDGKHLAFTQREADVEALTVLSTEDFSVVSNTNFGTDIEIDAFDWAGNERIIFSPARGGWGVTDFFQRTGELFGVDYDGSDFKVLFGARAGAAISAASSRVKGQERMNSYAEIIDTLPDEPNYILIGNMGYGVEGEFNSAWQMHLWTGKLKRIKKSPLRNGSFITDINREVRFVSGTNYDNTRELYYLNSNNDWELKATDNNQLDWFTPIMPLADGRYLISSMSEAGVKGVSIWNPKSDEKIALFHHENADITNLFHDNNGKLWAVGFLDHFQNYFYPDPKHPLAVLHQQLRKAFPSLDVQIIDETDDLSKIVIYISGPQNPGEFVLLDVKTMQYEYQLPKYPGFPLDILAPMDPIEFVARDGLKIRGYLTTPKDGESSKLPTVVMVHGGPFGIFDTWRFNYEAQLLADRGYAVLQVNYRGSGGQGLNFLNAGKGEWGGAMQDDITDATLWAINDGIADPERICIYGASYGAFSALSGVSKEPDLYKCAIGMSGVYDLKLLSEEGDIADAVRGQSYLAEYVGQNEALLTTRSPVNNGAAVKAKVMLIHGKLDDRAPIEHAERMKKALEDAGNEVVWISESKEDHGIMSEANRVNTYERVLSFLDANIGQ